MAYVYQNIIMGDTLSVGPSGAILDRTKGYLITGDGTKSVSIPVGADGTILSADSSNANGISWQPIAGGVVQAGDGLSFTGNVLNVGGSGTIGVSPDTVFVNSDASTGRPLLSTGTVGNPAAYGALDITNPDNVSGVLPVINGGTGTDGSTFISDTIVVVNSTGDGLTSGVPISTLPANFTTMTTDATPAVLATYTASGNAMTVEANILGASDTAAANFKIKVLIFNGTVINTDLMYAPIGTTWSAAVTATLDGSGGTAITITVTGAAGAAIGWAASVETLSAVSPP